MSLIPQLALTSKLRARRVSGLPGPTRPSPAFP